MLRTRRRRRTDYFKQHVAELTAEYRIAWLDGTAEVARRWEGGARSIHVPPIRGEVSYLVALHEIGHHVDAWTAALLDREVEAWRWAFANSLVAPSPATRRRIAERFWSYLALAAHDRRFKYTTDHLEFYCSLLT